MWVPRGLAVHASGKMSLHLPEEIREGLRGVFTLEQGLEDERHFLGGYPIPRAAGTKAQYVWEKMVCWRTASGLDITEVRCVKLGGE